MLPMGHRSSRRHSGVHVLSLINAASRRTPTLLLEHCHALLLRRPQPAQMNGEAAGSGTMLRAALSALVDEPGAAALTTAEQAVAVCLQQHGGSQVLDLLDQQGATLHRLPLADVEVGAAGGAARSGGMRGRKRLRLQGWPSRRQRPATCVCHARLPAGVAGRQQRADGTSAGRQRHICAAGAAARGRGGAAAAARPDSRQRRGGRAGAAARRAAAPGGRCAAAGGGARGAGRRQPL